MGAKRSGWKRLQAIAVLLALAALPAISPAQAQTGGDPTIYLPLIFRGNSNPIHQGIATYYYATGAGACSFDPSPSNLMVAAMDAPEWNNSAVCGEYVQVWGPKGTVTVRIVDLCPECGVGHLDLSEQAFALIANLSAGVVSITWQVVSPSLSGPIAY